MRRFKMSRSHSKRSFRRGATHTHRKNLSHVPVPGMRGGTRG